MAQSRRISTRMTSLVMTVVSILSLGGCRIWNESSWTDGELDQKAVVSTAGSSNRRVASIASTTKQAVVVSLQFHHVANDQLGPRFWEHLTETALPPDTRRAWLANGLRVGQLMPGDSLPVTTPNQTGSSDPVIELLNGTGVLGEQSAAEETISLRPAQLHQLPIGPGHEGETVILVRTRGGIEGRTLNQPQLTLDLTPQMGGREHTAELKIDPKLYFGPVRQKFIGSDAAVRIHAQRDQWTLDEMAMTWNVEPGATLVIAPAIDPGSSESGSDMNEQTFGLGHQMLRDTAYLHGTRSIVAVLKVQQVAGQ